MKLSELIRKKEGATATVATFATVTPPALPSVASVAVATATDGKPETLLDRHREARRLKVRAMLESAPGTHYAVLVEDAATDPVICTIAIRGTAAFEVEIPHKFYDGLVLLELIEKHSAGSSVETQQLPGNATGAPCHHERNTAHPGYMARDCRDMLRNNGTLNSDQQGG